MSYTAQDGHTESLTPWEGTHVTVLVEPGPRNVAVMNQLVGALDRAWEYYHLTTGRLPDSRPNQDPQTGRMFPDGFTRNGRDEIAEVSSVNCGVACTYVGHNGTEILRLYFEQGLYEIAQHNRYDQVPFYEMGRSFWFWSDQLAFTAPDTGDSVVTGFAVLMRFESMAAAGVVGRPLDDGTPFLTFESRVADLARQYEADPSLTFAQTLAQYKSPGAYGGGTDFWASLMLQLSRRHGGQAFLNRFFRYASAELKALTTGGAVFNWVLAASAAACVDLRPVFYTRWGFPQPNGTVSPRPPASAVPEPQGSCGVFFGGDVAGLYRVRPSSIHITSDENLRHIRWSGWGGAVAHGRGTAVFSRADRLPSSPVRLTLSNERSCGSRKQYLRLRIGYLRRGPYGRGATINYRCPGSSPSATHHCSIPHGGEGGTSTLLFTTKGISCTQGRPIVQLARPPDTVRGFSCRYLDPGPPQPGSRILCTHGGQEVRWNQVG